MYLIKWNAYSCSPPPFTKVLFDKFLLLLLLFLSHVYSFSNFVPEVSITMVHRKFPSCCIKDPLHGMALNKIIPTAIDQVPTIKAFTYIDPFSPAGGTSFLPPWDGPFLWKAFQRHRRSNASRNSMSGNFIT